MLATGGASFPFFCFDFLGERILKKFDWIKQKTAQIYKISGALRQQQRVFVYLGCFRAS